jgi:phosphodiesterase/alkaline phosphatase D-like protein
MLWTRFQVPDDQSAMAACDPKNTKYTYNYSPTSDAVTVHWFIGPNADGTKTITAGTFVTDGGRDWTVKVDADYSTGNVVAQSKLYYGFQATHMGVSYTSPIGHFRAIDSKNTFAELTYATVSCSNWGFGMFNAYDTLSKIEELDFYVHAGDNIYEYKDLRYPDDHMKLRTQITDPPHEIASLDDYRRRYRLYRNDASMQALGAHAPLISIADDHEYTNNAWLTGAENHQGHGKHSNPKNDGAGYDTTPYPEGDYYERMHFAMKAFFEYMPIRELDTSAMDAIKATVKSGPKVPQNYPGSPASEVTDDLRGWLAGQTRSFDFGGLVTVMTTEGRIGYRTSSSAPNNDGIRLPPTPTNATAPVTALITSVLAKGGPINWTQTDYTNIHTEFITKQVESAGW